MKNFKVVSSLVLAIAIVALSAPSFAQYSGYIFGNSGSSGYDGVSAPTGQSGRDVVVTANGQPETINIQGQDGQPGGVGREGGDAYNCHQGRPNSNLYGASGGDGGDGGDGGSGGDGGDLLVYSGSPANLKNIFVDSSPGRAGYAGYGARGGQGCRCWLGSWQGQVCHIEKQPVTTCAPAGCRPNTQGCSCTTTTTNVQVCNSYTFYCSDGRDGSPGRPGTHGSEGSYGSIQVVNRVQPLEATTPSVAVPFETVLSQNFALTRHEWDTLSGAANLFAPGSKVRNSYQQYAGKTVKGVQFKWLDTVRGVDYYKGQRATLALSGKPASVQLNLGSNVLADYTTETVGDLTTVRVNRSMFRSELGNISVEEIYGSHENLMMVLIDSSKVSDIAKTRIMIDSGWDLEGGGEYDKEVPQELIRSPSPGRIEVQLGRLPGIKASKIAKYFGDKTEFEMKVTREFAGASGAVVKDGKNVFDIVKEVKKKKAIKVKMEKE